MFSIPLVSPFCISYRTGLSPYPSSLERFLYTYSSYSSIFYILFLQTKREPCPIKRTGTPVVPPSFVTNVTHFAVSISIRVSYNDEILSPKPTPCVSVWKLRSPFNIASILILTDHQLSEISAIFTLLHQRSFFKFELII